MNALQSFSLSPTIDASSDLVCFCDLRWHILNQQPQHLLTSFVDKHRVFYIEKPLLDEDHDDYLSVNKINHNLWVITPKLKPGLDHDDLIFKQKVLLKGFFKEMAISHYIFWYNNSMAFEISQQFKPKLVLSDIWMNFPEI